MKAYDGFGLFGKSVKSIVKLAVESRRCDIKPAGDVRDLVILANGPSLNTTIAEYGRALESKALMAVNFAANAGVFDKLRPEYYVLCDPHFFESIEDVNVSKLYTSLSKVSWAMTLFVPVKYRAAARRLCQGNSNIVIAGFNPVAVEGWEWLKRVAFSSGRGMPRPRNVLIPSIMIGIKLGYGTIFIAGADHSWTKTLDVTDKNVVVSVQPHFYTENEHERQRIATEYRGYRLHQILESFTIAFRSYFEIADYASSKGVAVYNATPGSFIDAFVRKPLVVK